MSLTGHSYVHMLPQREIAESALSSSSSSTAAFASCSAQSVSSTSLINTHARRRPLSSSNPPSFCAYTFTCSVASFVFIGVAIFLFVAAMEDFVLFKSINLTVALPFFSAARRAIEYEATSGSSSSRQCSDPACTTDAHPLDITLNSFNLARVFERLHAGEPIRVGVIGGSISNGYGVPTTSTYYSHFVRWLNIRFPVNNTDPARVAHRNQTHFFVQPPPVLGDRFNSHLGFVHQRSNDEENDPTAHTYINRAVSAATSLFPSYCYRRLFGDGRLPHLIIVEFAVNDVVDDAVEVDEYDRADGFSPTTNIEKIIRALLTHNSDRHLVAPRIDDTDPLLNLAPNVLAHRLKQTHLDPSTNASRTSSSNASSSASSASSSGSVSASFSSSYLDPLLIGSQFTAILLLHMGGGRPAVLNSVKQQEIAARHYGVLTVDSADFVHDPLRLDQIGETNSLFLDLVHPTEKGHQVASLLIQEKLERLYDNYMRTDSVSLFDSGLWAANAMSTKERRAAGWARTILEHSPPALPSPLHPLSGLVDSSIFDCRLTYFPYGPTSSASNFHRIVYYEHSNWTVWRDEFHSAKAGFRHINPNSTEEVLTFALPHPVQSTLIVSYMRSWRPLASAEAWLTCDPQPYHHSATEKKILYGKWNSRSTQSSGALIWPTSTAKRRINNDIHQRKRKHKSNGNSNINVVLTTDEVQTIVKQHATAACRLMYLHVKTREPGLFTVIGWIYD